MASSMSEVNSSPPAVSDGSTGRPDAWRKQNLLSLDGGGIRGYWTLLVLGRLMEAIAAEEAHLAQNSHPHRTDSFWPEDFPAYVAQDAGQPIHYDFLSATQKYLPCHYFDFICGSSTGGLIAIMLGRLRMSVADCLQEYENLSHQIFGKPRWFSQRNLGFVPWSKYDAKAMEKVFQDVTRRRCERSALGPNQFSPPLFPTMELTCSVIVTTLRRTKSAVRIDPENLYILRSYDHIADSSGGSHRYNYGPAERMQLWQIARAATAAPMYFDEFKTRVPNGDSDTRIYFSDGGFGVTNNPTQVGIKEIETLIGRERISVIASIGTARAKNKPEGKGLFQRIKKMAVVATDPNTVANWLEDQNLENYWRLNDEEGLDVELDEWKPNGWTTKNPGRDTLEAIRNGFYRWAADSRNIRSIESCARALVAIRQERVLDRSRWQRFSLAASQYRCRDRNCREIVHDNLRSFNEHWNNVHREESNADAFREPRYQRWEYPVQNGHTSSRRRW